jgi:uncharacterized protein YyaL (SSP411 family)
MPSGAAVAIECLLALGRIAGDRRALDVAERYLGARAAIAAGQPYMSARLLAALDVALSGVELVVSEGEGRERLIEAAHRAYAPTLSLIGPWAEDSLRAGKAPAADGRAQAYVCRGQTCSAPVAEPGALAELLATSP